MEKYHTTAIGTEAYDKSYGVGYKVGHESWTPYPRVEKMKQAFTALPYDIDIQRLRLVTESYKAHENCSRKMQCAYAFQNVLENCDIQIQDGDLIVGEIAATPKSSPIYPEFSVNWIIDETLNHPFEEREHDKFFFKSAADRKELVELCRYWEGKTIADYGENRMDEAQKIGSQFGERIYQTNLYHYAGIGHYVIDYPRLMRLGFPGLVEEVQAAYGKLTKKDPEFDEKRDFYEASLMMLKAAQTFLQRHANLALQMAEKENDPKIKNELEMVAENCKQVSEGTPKTFWQALQLFTTATSLLKVEGNGHSVSYGRMDQCLYLSMQLI